MERAMHADVDKSDGYEFWLKAQRRAIVILDGDKCLKARNKIAERKGGSGFGISQSDCSFTLSTHDRHGVVIWRS
jgi:hypothetical protein